MKPTTFAAAMVLTAAAATAFGKFMLPERQHLEDVIAGKEKLRTDFFGITDKYKPKFDKP